MTADRQAANAQTGAAPERTLLQRFASAHFLISIALLAVFVAAFIGAQEWPTNSKMFPIMVTSVGAALALLNVVLSLRAPRQHAASAGRQLAGVTLTDEDDDEDEALEYVFARASRADWVRSLAWAGAFFVALLLIGAVPTIIGFTVLYLRLEARTSVLVAVLYAAVLGGLLFAAQELLDIILPPGLLFS